MSLPPPACKPGRKQEGQADHCRSALFVARFGSAHLGLSTLFPCAPLGSAIKHR
jgi:hypothetical protein